MTPRHPIVPLGFHEGELAVQSRVGVRADASRLRGMLDAADLGGGAAQFLASQNFAVICGRDHAGRLWASPLTGPAGFLEKTDRQTLRVHSTPALRDPLNDLPNSQHVGLLVIDFTKRRRYRINGWLAHTSGAGFTIEADQAYGNCPQYIQRRDLVPQRVSTVGGAPNHVAAQRYDPLTTAGSPAEGTRLAEADVAQIRTADTLFLGSTHPSRGKDASHRGGPQGFVRVRDEQTMWWPDYPGNNMFNSLGNLAVDPAAALLFCDFTSGRALHLSGAARLEHIARGTSGDDGDTGRRVVFTLERARAGPPTSLRAVHTESYPRNPAVTD